MLILQDITFCGIIPKNSLRKRLEFDIKIAHIMVTVKVIRKRANKHTYIKLVKSNMIQINTNYYFTKTDAINLIEKKQKWIEKNLNSMNKNILEDDEFLFLGIKHKNLDKRDIDKFYKEEASRFIPKIVEEYSNLMNLYPKVIKFRKNKRTWGSCNYKDELNFNYLLMKFPIEIIEYVVIHELSHIKYKNHSKDFWMLVETYCSDYKSREKLFKSFL